VQLESELELRTADLKRCEQQLSEARQELQQAQDLFQDNMRALHAESQSHSQQWQTQAHHHQQVAGEYRVAMDKTNRDLDNTKATLQQRSDELRQALTVHDIQAKRWDGKYNETTVSLFNL